MLSNFYRAVLPEQGQFCLFLLPEARHIWVDSINELARISIANEHRTGVYFGTAAFGTETRRTQTNVLALRALRLDIDAGPEKLAKHGEDAVYATQKAALAACVEFFRASDVAPSYIISSGAGLHIYYCLDEDLDPRTWLSLAKALSVMGRAHALKIDPSVTEDSARILRPIGALHNNGSRVRVLKATGYTHTLQDLQDKLGAPPPPKPNKYDLSINDDAISSFEGPPSSAFKVAAHCGALAEVAQAKGDVPEPFWRAMLGLVKHTTESADAAHEWSTGYDGYDSEETDRKLDAWATGPTTCAEFNKHTDACATCKFRGKVKSPIMLGLMTPVEVKALPEEKQPTPPPVPVPTGKPWDGKLPPDFLVTSDGGTDTLIHHATIETKNGLGEMAESLAVVPVTHEIFWFSHWADVENAGDVASITAHKWDAMTCRVKSFDVPASVLASRADLAKKLAECGVQISTNKRAQASMEHYTKAQFQRIKDMNRRLRVNDRFGLRIQDDGSMVSVHGKYLIQADGRISEVMVGPNLKQTSEFYPLPIPPQFSGEWDADVWDTHINPAAQKHALFMRENYTGEGMGKYQLAFMLGLASPLMAFVTGSYMSGVSLPPNGLSVSLYEREGGKGKTTLMQAVMLAYGKPEELSKDQNAQGSTDLARIAKLSMWGTMPASFDEMGRTGEKSVSNLISSVANGSGREGAMKDGGLRSTPRWALICLVSTNRSQRDMVTISEAESSAVQYRLLELDMNNTPDFDASKRNQFARQWADLKNTCSGALGAVVQRALCEMGPAEVNKLVMDCVERAAKMIDSDKEDRFQYRALGAMMALHVILSRRGLGMFNLLSMVNEFKLANDSAKVYVKENTLPTDGLDLLERAIHDLRPNTIITEATGYGKGAAQYRKYAVHIGGHLPLRPEARYIKEQGRLYLSVEALREWCKLKHVRDTEIIKAAKEANVLAPVFPSLVKEGRLLYPSYKYNLFAGMAEDSEGSVRCYSFDVHKLAKHVGPAVAEHLENPKVVPIRSSEAA